MSQYILSVYRVIVFMGRELLCDLSVESVYTKQLTQVQVQQLMNNSNRSGRISNAYVL